MVISLRAYLAIITALALERLFHLALASRNAHRAFALGAVERGQGHYPALAALHALFLVSAAAEAIMLRRPFPGALGWAALGAALGAQALRYWSIAALGSRWNTRIIVLPGASPVVRGPYRFMRHPNYLAVIIEIACVPMIRGCWITATVFSIANAVLLRTRIPAEEAALGSRYALEFRGRLRLVPKPPPRTARHDAHGRARRRIAQRRRGLTTR